MVTQSSMGVRLKNATRPAIRLIPRHSPKDYQSGAMMLDLSFAAAIALIEAASASLPGTRNDA